MGGREREARQTIEPVKKRNRFRSFLDLEFPSGLLLVYIILPKRKIALRNPSVYLINVLHFFMSRRYEIRDGKLNIEGFKIFMSRIRDTGLKN